MKKVTQINQTEGGKGILCPKPQSPKDKLGDLKFDTFNGDFGVECFVVEKQVTKSTFFLSNGRQVVPTNYRLKYFSIFNQSRHNY